MDTKLKSYSNRTETLCKMYMIFGTIFATLSLIGASIVVSTCKILNCQGEGFHDESGKFVLYISHFSMESYNEDALSSFVNYLGIASVCAGIIALIFIICAAVFTGRYNNKSENGLCQDTAEQKLNWFDRWWSELQIILFVGGGVLAVLLMYPLYEIWPSESRGNFFVPLTPDDSLYGVSNILVLFLVVVGMACCIAISIAAFVSLVKKIKLHMFWEKSIFGGAVYAISRGVKNSSETMIKIIAILIIGAFLSATWFGLPIVIILILVLVPKLIKEFMEIQTGVSEVKNGNLNYKIPVRVDKKGCKNELGRLAEDINEISQASNVAVQNELKNQRMKTELISNVSHDLKTPLTSMISYIDLIKTEGLDSPNAPEYLRIVDEKTQSLKVLTENLFEAAKASSGAIPVNLENIALGSLISQSIGEMSEKLSAEELQVIVTNDFLKEDGEDDNSEANPGDPLVRADGQLLWRVIENLLGNICKYAQHGSRVYINITRSDRHALLEIKNISRDPLNISADDLMERFTRGDESRNTEGSGLGLSIAKDLTKLMNGVFEITVDGDLFKAGVMLELA